MKAKEVLEKLNITRQTLTKYVKQGIIKVDSEINGRYIYNDESINNLLANKTVENISPEKTNALIDALEDIYNIIDILVKLRLLTGQSLEYVVDLKEKLEQIKKTN